MPSSSNDNGRAYEYICINVLYREISKHRKAVLNKTLGYPKAEESWNRIDDDMRTALRCSAEGAVEKIFDLEPMMLDGDDTLELLIQKDERGKEGDVRDILVIRSNVKWEIGFSLKHNHFAVKHSRLSPTIDFGENWYGHKCSKEYFDEIAPVFEYLEQKVEEKAKWEDLPNKAKDVYLPLLKAFEKELLRSANLYDDVPRKLVEYLLGEYDFYKMISEDKRRLTILLAFNLRGDLNKSVKKKRLKIVLPRTCLPQKILYTGLKEKSDNTLIISMDEGWQFSLRIHSAKKEVERSLKFDIQIVGMPMSLVKIDCYW